MNGVLVVDKPSGMTSHDVVHRVRKILQQRSVGHLGTLDPLATGVLPLIVGNLTRLAQFYLASEKTYEGTIRFGFSTDTYDADGLASPAQAGNFSLEQLMEKVAGLRGVIEQMPPPFSAKKIQGVPAYKLARQQKEVSLKSVKVEIHEFDILGLENERATFRVRVSAGTYVRSLAHEIGQQLGCGAHLQTLRRTASGEFTMGDARTLDEIVSGAASGQTEDLLIHPRKLLPHFPCVTVNEDTTAHLRNGRAVNLLELSSAELVKVFQGQRDLVAIAKRVAGTLFHPKIVFMPEPVVTRKLAPSKV